MAQWRSWAMIFVCCIFGMIKRHQAYKHVVMMHGILAGPKEYDTFRKYIQKVHPGTGVTVIDAYDFTVSLLPMWNQVKYIGDQVEKIMDKHKEGINLVCFSQGGLICRALVESLPNHNIENFIALSSPQAGQYGDSEYLRELFPMFVKETIYKFFYTSVGQYVSVGNYWNDPHHQALYRNYSVFLPVINNEVKSANSSAYKKNYLRLKNFIMIGGPDDGVITPWQSSMFGFYNEKEQVIEMKHQKDHETWHTCVPGDKDVSWTKSPYKVMLSFAIEWYLEDSFGLQTLDKRGALHTYVVPGIGHFQWHESWVVFKNCIAPWLT